MEALHEFSAPPGVAVSKGDNIQLEYFADGVTVLTKEADATNWVHIPITVPKRLNGKDTKLKKVETRFQAGANKVQWIRVIVDNKEVKEQNSLSLSGADEITSITCDISPPAPIGSSGVIISFRVNIKRLESVILDGAIVTLSDA